MNAGMGHDLMEFAGKAGIILGTMIAAITFLKVVWRWTPFALRFDVDRLDRVLTRFAAIVELQAIIQTEAVDSPERAEAIGELSRLRRVSLSEVKDVPP